jgi:DNA polymerase bacteriophage-type
MSGILYTDYEAMSACDIKRFGAYKYAKHPTTRLICMAWAFNDQSVRIWKAQEGEPFPEEVICHMMYEHGEVWAHNAVFERLMTNYVLRPFCGAFLEIEQMVCTLVQCANMALPLSLENAATALCLPERKDMEKRKIAQKIWKPVYTDPCTGDHTFATPETHPEEFQANYDYCMGDVEVERAIAKQVKRISPLDRKVYIMDQRINDRGMRVDIPLVHTMKRLAFGEQQRLNGELQELCGLNYTQTAKLGDWVRKHGFEVPSLDKHHLGNLLKRTDLPDRVRRALLIRQEANKSSVSKLDAMLRRCEDDWRGRGCFQFKGAVATGRWAHREIQSGNLPRPTLEPELIETILDWLNGRKPEDDEDTLDTIRVLWGRPMQVFSDCLRGLLIPAPGKVFIAPDLVSIESLVAAWLVGDDPKVAFMGAGGDVYKEVARLILGLAPFRGWTLEEGVPVTKKQRQMYGKVPELAFGYQGGYKEDGAVGTFCAQNNVDYPGEEEAKRWQSIWREYHPKHVQYWNDVNQAAIDAVLNPGPKGSKGTKFSVGPEGRQVTFRMDGRFLLCRLPSESVLCYPMARIEQTKFGPAMTYMKSKDKRWFRNKYYGGHGLENNTQAVAKDLLAWGMLNLEEEGYEVVNDSHDEAVVETDKQDAEAHVMEVFTRRPPWAATLPYRSSAFTAKRYRK